ncbi:transposase [Piscirickettsia salmonis]|uniref:transposase n=1 Tax=Piscirickettsia salmonis TaxID=1238 RepID=UPI003A8026DA
MSQKRKKPSAEFKTKVVLEVIEGDQTLNQICSKYELVPKTVQNWKKVFLANASLAFNIDSAVRKRRYLGRYFAHPMMQNRRAKRDDYKPSAALVTGHYVP